MLTKIADPKRILIVKLSSIGDVVMTTPVARALRQAYPDAYLAWVVEAKSKDVVLGNPYLDDVIVWNRQPGPVASLGGLCGFLAGLGTLRPKLRERNFDVAIDFQGLLRSALVAVASGARYRLGYDNAREGAPLLYNTRLRTRQHRVRGPQQYLNMLSLLEISSDDLTMHMPVGEDDRGFAREFLADAGATYQQVVAMCPATTWPQKHWTAEGWARLADALVTEHKALPVFLGSSVDTPLIERIASLMTCTPADASGKTTLKQAAAIIEQSSLTVAVDTGLLHIALALGGPTIGIFGPTRWKHFAKKDNFAVIAKDFPCMPCLRHPVCKHFDCMSAVAAEDVLQAARAWLAGGVLM